MDPESRESFQAKHAHGHYLRSLIPFFWPKDNFPLRVRLVVSVILLIIEKSLDLLTPFAYKAVIDSLADDSPSMPTKWIFLYIGGRFVSSFLSDIRDVVFSKLSQTAVFDISVRALSHLHFLPTEYHIKRKTGSVLRAIDRGSRAVEYLVSFATFSFLPTMIEILLVVVLVSSIYTVDIAFTILLALSLYIGFTVMCTEWRTKFRRHMNDKDSLANDRAVDSLINFEVVKSFGNERMEINRYKEAMADYNEAAIVTAKSSAALNVGQAFLINLGMLGVMLIAAKQVVHSDMTVGDFVLLLTYLMQLSIPLSWLGSQYRMLKNGAIDLERLMDLLDEPVTVKDVPDAPPLVPRSAAPQIEFRNVRFGYDRSRGPTIKDISFTIPPAKTLAIVGPSGSGKSTIAKLLFRFYDLWSGQILIDGQDAARVTQASLRKVLAPVTQNPVLFNESMEYNIRYGRPDATSEEVREAARLAQLEPFIEGLPDKYETKVGERGLRLSGGELQRVAIARAILKRAPVFLFDEATSALDTQTEREIQAALFALSRNRTTLVIAHRLSTIVDADEIMVLKNGQIAERGNHAALLELKGEYYKMWQRQKEARDAETILHKVKVEEAEELRSTTETADIPHEVVPLSSILSASSASAPVTSDALYLDDVSSSSLLMPVAPQESSASFALLDEGDENEDDGDESSALLNPSEAKSMNEIDPSARKHSSKKKNNANKKR
eukprot:ANDGO_02380.mRNA.1 ABC transporter B family member 5